MTDKVLMVRPASFNFNEETAGNNLYQHRDNQESNIIQERALKEFNDYVDKLTTHGIKVEVLDDIPQPATPDSIFPNNWFASFEDKTVIFPMFAQNRREEVIKFKDKLEKIEKNKQIIDMRKNIPENEFLEGTGSIILDRDNSIAYACLSPRTNKDLFIEFCKKTNYKPVYFHAYQDKALIYHTNVMMSVTKDLAIICLDTIENQDERKNVVDSLIKSGKEIIEISLEQVKNFLANVLEVNGYLIMSKTAFKALTTAQRDKIEKYMKILPVDVNTIEYYGGGSARCMIAELY